jgi:hypothetical protein
MEYDFVILFFIVVLIFVIAEAIRQYLFTWN